MENPNLCTICSEFTYDQQNEHNIKVHQIFCQKKQNKLKTKTSVVFVSRKTGQIDSSCTHYKPYSNGAASKSSGRSTYTNRLISCPTCMDLIWTHNISTHFNNRHQDSDKSIFESLKPSRKEILAVHNWGVKSSTIPNYS